MIRLSILDRFGGSPTQVSIAGEDEQDICNILVSKLQVADYEVEIENEVGELVPFEDFSHE